MTFNSFKLIGSNFPFISALLNNSLFNHSLIIEKINLPIWKYFELDILLFIKQNFEL